MFSNIDTWWDSLVGPTGSGSKAFQCLRWKVMKLSVIAMP
jgi:hypothetical protein